MLLDLFMCIYTAGTKFGVHTVDAISAMLALSWVHVLLSSTMETEITTVLIQRVYKLQQAQRLQVNGTPGRQVSGESGN